MARAPKPIEMHRIEGTTSEAGRRRIPGTRKRAPGAAPAAPVLVGGRRKVAPPRGLAAKVRVAFVAIAKECEAVLDAADAPMVEAAAVMLVRARVAGADVEKRGMLVTGRFDTLVENPSVKQERDAWASFRSFAEQLGIGPSARARLAGLAVDGRDASDELEGLGELRAISGGRP